MKNSLDQVIDLIKWLRSVLGSLQLLLLSIGFSSLVVIYSYHVVLESLVLNIPHFKEYFNIHSWSKCWIHTSRIDLLNIHVCIRMYLTVSILGLQIQLSGTNDWALLHGLTQEGTSVGVFNQTTCMHL
jgi:hypothetical protein